MNKLDIQLAQINFPEYLKHLISWEKIIVCNHNVPIAEIHSIDREQKRKRFIGLAKDVFSVPVEFFEPLPQEILDSFCLIDNC